MPQARLADRWIASSDDGRLFGVYVAFGPRASAATRTQAWAILVSPRASG